VQLHVTVQVFLADFQEGRGQSLLFFLQQLMALLNVIKVGTHHHVDALVEIFVGIGVRLHYKDAPAKEQRKKLCNQKMKIEKMNESS